MPEKEPYSPYVTADDKRKMGASIGTFDPVQATRWKALGDLQDAGRLDDYRAAVTAWKEAEPEPWDFLPPDDRAKLEAEREALRAESRAEVERIWGPLASAAPGTTFPVRRKEPT